MLKFTQAPLASFFPSFQSQILCTGYKSPITHVYGERGKWMSDTKLRFDATFRNKRKREQNRESRDLNIGNIHFPAVIEGQLSVYFENRCSFGSESKRCTHITYNSEKCVCPLFLCVLISSYFNLYTVYYTNYNMNL